MGHKIAWLLAAMFILTGVGGNRLPPTGGSVAAREARVTAMDRTDACRAARVAIRDLLQAPHAWTGSCVTGERYWIGRTTGDEGAVAWHVVGAVDSQRSSGRTVRLAWFVTIDEGADGAYRSVVNDLDEIEVRAR